MGAKMIDFNYKILSGIVNFFLFNSMGIFFYLYSVYFIDLFLRILKTEGKNNYV